MWRISWGIVARPILLSPGILRGQELGELLTLANLVNVQSGAEYVCE